MKRTIFIFFGLMLCSRISAAPTNTMSFTPAPADGAIIQASDHQSYNNETATKFNAHDHTDITKTTNNSFTIGDSATGNKSVIADNGAANLPYIRYDDTQDKWVFSNNGTTSSLIPTTTATSSSKVTWKETAVSVLDILDQADVAYTDIDLTASTSADAIMAILSIGVATTTSGEYVHLYVRKNGSSQTANFVPRVSVPDAASSTSTVPIYNTIIVGLDTDEIIEYSLDVETTSTGRASIDVIGYIE